MTNTDSAITIEHDIVQSHKSHSSSSLPSNGVQKKVSFASDITLHSHDDWSNRLASFRMEKKSKRVSEPNFISLVLSRLKRMLYSSK